MVNSQPEIFSNVRAEFANGVGALANGRTAVGEFRNFQLATNGPEPVENTIDELVAAWRQMLNESNLRPGEKQRLGDRFQKVTQPMKTVYQRLKSYRTNPCVFPATIEPPINAQDYNRNSCQALFDFHRNVVLWGFTFNRNCRLERRGEDPLLKFNRLMNGGVKRLMQHTSRKLEC